MGAAIQLKKPESVTRLFSTVMDGNSDGTDELGARWTRSLFGPIVTRPLHGLIWQKAGSRLDRLGRNGGRIDFLPLGVPRAFSPRAGARGPQHRVCSVQILDADWHPLP